MVTVTSATSQGPTVFPLMSCGSGSGDMVTIGCLATGFTPSSLTFEWKQGTNPLNEFIQYPAIPSGSNYMGISQIQVARQDWDERKSFECVAKHPAGDTSSLVIKPNMAYELPTLKVCSSIVDGKDEASFSCFAKDFSPNKYEFKWLKDGTEINSKVDEITSLASERKDTNGTTLYSAASLLTIKTTDLGLDTKFTCVFKGKGKNNTEPELREDVFFKECTSGGEGCPVADVDIDIIKPTNQDILQNGVGHLKCRVTVTKGGFDKVAWEDGSGKELVSSNRTVKNGIYEAVLDITYDEWKKGMKLNCIVHHKNWLTPLERAYERNSGGSEKRPSVFMLPPIEQTRTGEVVLTCFVKDFFPREVFVSWFVDDEEANSKYPFNTTEPVERDGYYSVYSHLTLTTEQWEDLDAVYSCAVYHESVAKSTKAIVRSAGSRTFKNTNMVNLNMNIPETCKAM